MKGATGLTGQSGLTGTTGAQCLFMGQPPCICTQTHTFVFQEGCQPAYDLHCPCRRHRNNWRHWPDWSEWPHGHQRWGISACSKDLASSHVRKASPHALLQ